MLRPGNWITHLMRTEEEEEEEEDGSPEPFGGTLHLLPGPAGLPAGPRSLQGPPGRLRLYSICPSQALQPTQSYFGAPAFSASMACFSTEFAEVVSVEVAAVAEDAAPVG
mmetsp:Transcript_13589/g.36605  ORF Transcript_13589/g.36605 Transcript_13589/m.36605 type:complete len:110 (-) Transcript_13589:72-401(-)